MNNTTLAQFYYGLVITVILGYLLIIGRELFIPLIVAFFIWYLLHALTGKLRKYAPKLTYLHLPLSIILLLLFFSIPVQLISGTIPQIISKMPIYQKNFLNILQPVTSYVGDFPQLWSTNISEEVDVVAIMTRLASELASFAGDTILILLYLVFLIIEQRYAREKVLALFRGDQSKKHVNRIIDDIFQKIETYIWVKTWMSLLTGITSYVIIRWMNVDFAAFWAVLIFFLNFIPTIGSLLGVVLPALLCLVQFETMTPFFVVLFGCGALQFLIGNFLEPKFLGKSLNLSPFVIVVSLVFWGYVWGIVGAFLSIPMMVIIMIVLSAFPSTQGIAVLLSAKGKINTST